MNASLFFLCPTDCLESIVNKNYKGNNYFYTSPGNNSSFDLISLESIKALICRHDIKNIYFVLSEQNKIVIDAKHLCVNQRGIKDVSGSTITSEFGGVFKNNYKKQEFLDYIKLPTEF